MTAITPKYAHAYQSLCLAGRALVVRHQKFRLPAVRISSTLEPLHVKKATTFKDGPCTQMEELVSLRAKPQLVGALSPLLLTEGYRVAGWHWAPFVSKLGMVSLLANFSVGMGSFGRSGRSKFRCGSQISSPFLGLSSLFFWRFKNIKVGVCKKSFETPSGWTKMHVV